MSDTQDPLALLMETAKRKDCETKAKLALSAAKVALMCGTWNKVAGEKDSQHRPTEAAKQAIGASAFFTRLVLAPRYEPCWDIDTACTDGTTIRYNPEYVSTNTKAVIVGLLAEEGGHTGFGHHVRMAHLAKQYGDDYDAKLANVAADLALLGLLKQAWFDIPADCCLPGEKGPYKDFPVGEAMEAYYARLHQKKQQGGGKDPTGGKGCPGRGDVQAPQNQTAPGLKQAMQKAKELLQAAKQEGSRRGTLAAGLEYAVSTMLKPVIDAREVLAEFLSKFAETDRSWQRPNRRYASQGIYLPSEAGQTLGHLVFLNDTSGSLDNDKARQRFLSEAVGMVSAYPLTKVSIIHHDSVVQAVEEWTPGDGSELPWHPKGGGGTSHVPPFDAMYAMDEPVDLCIAMTDLETQFHPDAPDFPVLWCTVKDHPIPYGQAVDIGSLGDECW
jgi:predicted metal-dependent peptidase